MPKPLSIASTGLPVQPLNCDSLLLLLLLLLPAAAAAAAATAAAVHQRLGWVHLQTSLPPTGAELCLEMC